MIVGLAMASEARQETFTMQSDRSVGLALVRPALFRDIGAFYQVQYGRTARLVFE